MNIFITPILIYSQRTLVSWPGLFESILQEGLACRNGWRGKKVLIKNVKVDPRNRFDSAYAINVLKHGRGGSYDALVTKCESLPFRIKLPGKNFFFEGGVSGISTLIVRFASGKTLLNIR